MRHGECLTQLCAPAGAPHGSCVARDSAHSLPAADARTHHPTATGPVCGLTLFGMRPNSILCRSRTRPTGTQRLKPDPHQILTRPPSAHTHACVRPPSAHARASKQAQNVRDSGSRYVSGAKLQGPLSTPSLSQIHLGAQQNTVDARQVSERARGYTNARAATIIRPLAAPRSWCLASEKAVRASATVEAYI